MRKATFQEKVLYIIDWVWSETDCIPNQTMIIDNMVSYTLKESGKNHIEHRNNIRPNVRRALKVMIDSGKVATYKSDALDEDFYRPCSVYAITDSKGHKYLQQSSSNFINAPLENKAMEEMSFSLLLYGIPESDMRETCLALKKKYGSFVSASTHISKTIREL